MKLFLLALVCTFCCATTARADDKIYIDADCIAITDNGICLSVNDELVFGISQLNYDEYGYFVHDRDFYDEQRKKSEDESKDRHFYTMNYNPRAPKNCDSCRKKRDDSTKRILLACKSN